MYPNLFIFGTCGEVFTVGAEAYTPNIEVSIFRGCLVNQNAVMDHEPIYGLLREAKTYVVLAPVLVSYIWADRLHPVARYFPSAEKRTQQTTLRTRSQSDT